MPKQYASPETYEIKLEKVMSRFGVEKYEYNWDRFICWVQFFYKGQLYRFEHSVENAKNHGANIRYGSDAFAQLVLTLEDIARMTERGIYELQTWISGLRTLPAAKEIPKCFHVLGFDSIPTQDELKKQYRELAKIHHPDNGGNERMFIKINSAFEEAEKALKEFKNV